MELAGFNNLVTCTPNTPDVWYKVHATTTSHVVKIDGNGTFSPAFAIFAASQLRMWPTRPVLCAGPGNPQTTTIRGVSGLTIGATYYIKVSDCLRGAIIYNHLLYICVLTPVHDEPCTAIDLPIPVLPGETTCSNPVTGNMLLLATGNDLSVSCSGSSVAQPDLWYRFVAAIAVIW